MSIQSCNVHAYVCVCAKHALEAVNSQEADRDKITDELINPCSLSLWLLTILHTYTR